MCHSKSCIKCGLVKPIAEFYKNVQMKDGHLNVCKVCYKAQVLERRHGAGREKVLAYERERNQLPLNKIIRGATTRAWQLKYPERVRAQSALADAVRIGKVVKLPCFVCGRKAVAHHPDYSRPLDVVWLCQAHHLQAHALVKEI